MPVQPPDVLKSYFNKGDVPTESNYIDLIDSLFGGTGSIHNLNQIILYRPSISNSLLYEKSFTGLSNAIGQAVSGSKILIPPCDLTNAIGITVPANVGIVGLSREKCILRMPITVNSGSGLFNLSIIREASDLNNIFGVYMNSDGEVSVNNCKVFVNQIGSGLGYAIRSLTGVIKVRNSSLYGSTSNCRAGE